MASTNKPAYEYIVRRLRSLPLDEPIPSYEWEELVQKLCDSGDATLHDIGLRELHELKLSHPRK